MLADQPRTEIEVRRHIAEYYAMISHLDSAIGRVIAKLVERGVLEDTIIVFAADKGLAFGKHGLMGKQNLCDHSVHEPLIFSGSGIAQGETCEALTFLLDIFPTLCDLLNINIPCTVEGKSLVPLVRSSSEMGREYLHFAFMGYQCGIRDSQFKFIEYVVDGEHCQTQLVDLLRDPNETVNLVSQSEHVGTLTRLRNELMKWQNNLDDSQEGQGEIFWNA